MITLIRIKSLKTKLIVCFTAIIMIISIFICSYYYYNQEKSLEENMIKDSYNSINYLLNNVEKQLKLCDKLADWIYINRDIGKVLIRDYSNKDNKYNIDIPPVQRLIDDGIRSSSIGEYIISLIVMGNNGIYLSAGLDSDWIDKQSIGNITWFQDGINKKGVVYWTGVAENPAAVRHDDYILPIVRPVIFADTFTPIGWSMIGFKPSLISDVFDNYELNNKELLFIIDSNQRCVFHNEVKYIGSRLEQYGFIEKVIEQESGHFSTYLDHDEMLVSFLKSDYSDMVIVNVLPFEYIKQQKIIVSQITFIIIILSIVIFSAFTVFLSSRLTKPLRNLLNQMKKISSGNFSRDDSIEGSDEMGSLGKGINKMAENVEKLMYELLEKEREKKALEFKILQSQINPHFVYNTLNSIKMMATIQRADGIKDMVTALSVLLKEVSKGASEKIKLKEEINLVDKYVYIQTIRCKGMVRIAYHIEDPSLYQCKILKFTLQPIVENAIFHGLSAKRGVGRINIEILQKEDKVIINILDNGIGMSYKKINHILTGTEKGMTGFNSTGVRNIDERLKLTYGQEYGLIIESSEGEYTKVSIVIPKEA